MTRQGGTVKEDLYSFGIFFVSNAKRNPLASTFDSQEIPLEFYSSRFELTALHNLERRVAHADNVLSARQVVRTGVGTRLALCANDGRVDGIV